MICRLLPHESRSGPANMALDEALLDEVDRDPSSAFLRTYAWDEPTLSLGYFQSVSEVEADPRWQGVPIVRRPSGGGALWHDKEITYALIVPRRHPLANKPANLYRAVHSAIVEILREGGIPASTRGNSPNDDQPPRPFLCFLDRDSEDILVTGAKVVGSAQRRRPAAVLQHGSLLLARSGLTPELPGLADLMGDLAAPPEGGWVASIRNRLPGSLGMIIRADDLPSLVRDHAQDLEARTYRNPSWTAKR